VVVCRDTRTAAQVAQRYLWLVDRVMNRLAVWWPNGVDVGLLRAEATLSLRRVSASAERIEDVPDIAAAVMARRVRRVLTAGTWFHEAVAARARPLCEAWRGALVARREPTDRTLARRLWIGEAQLAERFLEFGVLLCVDAGALLPAGLDLCCSVAETVATLAPNQRLATALYFHEELTLPEIGRVMDVPAERVQELLGRAGTAVAAEATLAAWPGRRFTA